MENRKTWKVWVHSDLQLAVPAQAKTVLSAAIDDLLNLDLNLDAAWCLGDALCGSDQGALNAVARINLEEMRRLGIPVVYLLGNHEMDLKRFRNLDHYPLYELARCEQTWKCARSEEFYFTQILGKTLVVFMGDHYSERGTWWTTHGEVQGDDYPHLPDEYQRLRKIMERHDGPVLMASHYAFPGGQRPSALMGNLLPLPKSVRAHFHGHAHIGDLVHNGERPWQRANPIEGETLLQFNISALETERSARSHSAILEFGDEGPISLRIRCHLSQQWCEEFIAF